MKSREKSFTLLNLYRKTKSQYALELYQEANSNYKRLCHIKKKEYGKQLLEKLSNVRDAKQWGLALRELRGKKFICGNNITPEDFAAYFENMMNPRQMCNSFSFAAPLTIIDTLDNDFTVEEIMACLKKAKNMKAPGMDRIPYECYKNSPIILIEKLKMIFCQMYSTGTIPISFNKSILFPLHKKGNLNDVGNYRGIAFMDTIQKIFTGVLLARIETWIDRYKKLNEYQAGFRRGYSTSDCIYSLSSIVKIKCAEPKQKLYAFFIDFKAAFDRVNRNALLYKLHNVGISTQFINIIKSLYTNTQVSVWNGTETSNFFEVHTGVKQGCLLSPILFALYINDLHDELPEGVDVHGWNIKLLMYADDIVILGSSPQSLQKMINTLSSYCDTWDLEINLAKSKILIFGSGGRRKFTERWYYRGNEVEIVKSYNYLGVVISPKMSFQIHLDNKLRQAKNNINSLWTPIYQKPFCLSSKLKLFQTLTQTLVCYAAQVWGYKEYESVEKVQKYFIKKLLMLPTQTPNYMIYIETGVTKIYLFTLKLHFNYIMKTLKYNIERLPNHLTKVLIAKKLFWYADWMRLAEQCGVELDIQSQNLQHMEISTEAILAQLEYIEHDKQISLARNSILHDEYKNLDYTICNKYLNDSVPTHKIMTIFKLRGGMANLNARAFQNTASINCSMCNLNSPENVFHFVAQCPILREFRRQHFNQPYLDREEFIAYMNGSDFTALYNFAVAANKYRTFLVNEYNH